MPVTWAQAKTERNRIMDKYVGVECLVITDDIFLVGEWGVVIHDVRPSEKKTSTQLALFIAGGGPDGRFPAFSSPTDIVSSATAYP